jgi:putative copper resistance protein D
MTEPALSIADRRNHARIRMTAAIVVATAIVALLATLTLAGGGYTPAAEGLPDPGAVVTWGLPIVRFATDIAAALTVGWLVSAAFLALSSRDGVVSHSGRGDLLRAVSAAAAWAFLSIVQLFFTLALVLGIPLSQALSPGIAGTFAMEIPQTRSLAIVAIVVTVVAIGAALTSTTGITAFWLVIAVGACVIPALSGHGSGLGDHALAISAGVTHIIAAVLWLGPLIAIVTHGILARAGKSSFNVASAARKFGVLALICVLLLAASGLANAYTRLDNATQLWTTGYGQVVLLKVLLLVVLVLVAAVIRKRLIPRLPDEKSSGNRSVFIRWLSVEIGLITLSFALGVTLALSAYPRVETRLPTIGETLLGFLYPPAPTWDALAFGFRLEPVFFVGALVAGGLYLAGVIRLLRRGDHWPWGRTIAWIIGLVIVIWTTNGGIATYAQVSVGWHMVQHMTMTMLAPILLVLGAPATLALRALHPAKGPERGPREWLMWFLHTPLMRLLTNPIFVLAIYVLGLYGLYFTGLFGWLMGSHVGHIAMEVHFLASGYLFAWIIIGIDPRPRPLAYWARFAILLVALALHALFAVVIMMGNTPLGIEWFGMVRPPWVPDPLADTRFGGGVAWGLGEIPTLFLLVALVIQWSRADDREARRIDRQADRDDNAELRAYNDYLAGLNSRPGQND